MLMAKFPPEKILLSNVKSVITLPSFLTENPLEFERMMQFLMEM